MVFGALNDILLSVPAFHLLFASCETWGDAVPSPPAGGWGCAQHGAGMQTQQHLLFPTPSFLEGESLFLCIPSPGRWELLPWAGSLLGERDPVQHRVPTVLLHPLVALWCAGMDGLQWLLSIRFGSWTDCQGICHCLGPVQESQQDF